MTLLPREFTDDVRNALQDIHIKQDAGEEETYEVTLDSLGGATLELTVTYWEYIRIHEKTYGVETLALLTVPTDADIVEQDINLLGRELSRILEATTSFEGTVSFSFEARTDMATEYRWEDEILHDLGELA